MPLYDWALALLAIPVIGYVTVYSDYLAERWPMTLTYAMSNLEIVFGVLATGLILEATRRILGWPLVIVAIIVLLYTYYGEHMPFKVLRHRVYTFEHMLDYLYMTDNGIWGVALGVAATYIVLFVIFGAFAEKAGVSDFFIDFANSIAGHTKGGPAKVAIFSSGMIGSVTGSTVANVYTTGQFTIPMMRKLGYRPAVAGAVEALASNGGQIMPPILGATAFILAAYSGVPYVKVALASLIPALLYFGGLFWFIHLEAHKTGLSGIPKSEKPDVLDVLLKGGHLVSPLLVLISCLVYGYSPVRAAFFAIVFTVIISWVRKETRLGPRRIIEALEAGAKSSVLIVISCATVGFVIGGFLITGVGLNVSSAIINLSGGYFFTTLLMIGLACLVLGTGMNTVAAFILVSVVGTPALTGQGVDTACRQHVRVLFRASVAHHPAGLPGDFRRRADRRREHLAYRVHGHEDGRRGVSAAVPRRVHAVAAVDRHGAGDRAQHRRGRVRHDLPDRRNPGLGDVCDELGRAALLPGHRGLSVVAGPDGQGRRRHLGPGPRRLCPHPRQTESGPAGLRVCCKTTASFHFLRHAQP